jgi:AhpD family alkylhydroperoxidase
LSRAASDTHPRLDFETHAKRFYAGLARLDRAATEQLEAVDFDPRVRELVRIRASQINGCAYCIDMHTKDARAIGETEQRIYALNAWRETPFFSKRERAALALTEAVTQLADGHAPGALEEARAEFPPEEVAALLSLIVMINAWNAVAVSTHAWEPGSYEARDSAAAGP